MQPRQTDPVVEREANGYKAEVFSRQRVFYPINSNEELNAIGVAAAGPDASHPSLSHAATRQCVALIH